MISINCCFDEQMNRAITIEMTFCFRWHEQTIYELYVQENVFISFDIDDMTSGVAKNQMIVGPRASLGE